MPGFSTCLDDIKQSELNSEKTTLFFLFAVILYSCNIDTVRMEKFEVHGIDVSHYQGRIDWGKVAAQDIDFVFVKATEGGLSGFYLL